MATQSCSIFKPKKSSETPENTAQVVSTTPITPKWDKPAPKGETSQALLDILNKDPFVANILAQPEEYNVQILYTSDNVKQKSKGLAYSTLSINNDPKFYFYPASMVKLPIAILALQKIKQLNDAGVSITRNSTMLTLKSTAAQTSVLNDPTTPDGRPTIAQYIRKIFLTSDNDASNRLYEFLGQEYINTELQKRGFPSAQIIHRLSTGLPTEEHRFSNPIKFLHDSTGKLLMEQSLPKSTVRFEKRRDTRGRGYLQQGKLVEKPFDFSDKNRLSLADMHRMIQATTHPEIFGNVFDITEDDRKFLLQYMSQWPSESIYPSYDTNEVWDTYVKFNYYGSDKKHVQPNIRIFNKVGFAYGYITDASYIADIENGIDFWLSITIHVNKDGIYNDDKYETDDIALPFMKRVGELLYEHEKSLKKPKKDLSAFNTKYIY
jgi:hypothetical protein